MATAIETLLKILAHEKKTGLKDKAVMGGLAQYVAKCRDELKAASVEGPHLAAVEEVVTLLASYTQETRDRRQQMVQAAVEKLQGLPPLPRAPRVRAPRPAPVAPPAPKEVAAPAPIAPSEKLVRELSASATTLRGVKEAQAKKLKRLGVQTVDDLLHLFPRRYQDFSALKTINRLQYGEEVTIIGQIKETTKRETRRGFTLITSIVTDGTGFIEATWFNQPWLLQRLRPGRQIVLSGKVEEYLGRLTFQSPEWEHLSKELLHTARLVPIYPLTEGLTARWLRAIMKSVVDRWANQLPDHLPAYVRERAKLADLPTAIANIHFPENGDVLERARRRLAFDEFLLIQLGVLRQRRMWQKEPGQPLRVDDGMVGSFVGSLPFALTVAQRHALDEILADVQKTQPMNRLLQGDVGSGKTVVAAAAMRVAIANGKQAALMAPTEILAEQHYHTLSDLLKGTTGANIRLLIGSMTKSEKEAIRAEIASGQTNVIVGTHALIQEHVEFQNLALVVIDEQHRFGVEQRAALRQKGFNPHLLVMSATPIPRTLALTLYGDLDLSILDEMPPGRQPIKTRWLMPLERERAYTFLRKQVGEGRQGYVICPLVEESDKVEAKAAVEEHRRLQHEIFPDLKLGLLHGRMKGDEKEATMRAFKDHQLDILVSTAVVEVGIDVPNATVMVVEGADRFGLAQLHQFRGRVGRGEHASYCLLLSDARNEQADERLKIIESTHDGFKLAEADLEMRGPGEFFGTRQSGLPDLKIAKLSDVKILEQARAEALEIFQRDPDLALPEHHALAEKVREFWKGEGDLS